MRSLSIKSTRPFVLTLMGKPGGGKGTVSKWLVEDFDFTHLSTGDILRQEVKLKTENGLKVEKLIRSGRLVPDIMISNILFLRVKSLTNQNKNRILLDGYPRTINQARLLKSNNYMDVTINLAAALNVPNEEIVERLSDRWVHEPSGRIYSYSFNPPKEEGLDNDTREPLIRRTDDEPKTIAKRLSTYETETYPLLDFYTKEGSLKTFSGESQPALLKDNKRSKAIYSELSTYLRTLL